MVGAAEEATAVGLPAGCGIEFFTKAWTCAGLTLTALTPGTGV